MKEEDVNRLAWKIAYKYWFPSGCDNCWGDLGIGCTDACRRSGNENTDKFTEIKAIIQEFVPTSKRIEGMKEKPFEHTCVACDHEQCPNCKQCHNSDCEYCGTPFSTCFDLLTKK